MRNRVVSWGCVGSGNSSADSATLKAGGVDFLTRAFHAAGSLARDNRVVRITEFQEVSGRRTGRKLRLSVAYEKSVPGLHTDLFVKFSRDLDNDIRDQAKSQMELEVLFALLSHSPAFPIAVPVCYFSDYHHASGTGVLITQRIAYGMAGVEPHYPKCSRSSAAGSAWPLPRADYGAEARLAGTHKAGRLPDTVEKYFPFDPSKLVVSLRAPHTPAQISKRVASYAQFAATYPQLLPENIRSDEFLLRFTHEAPRFQALANAGQ